MDLSNDIMNCAFFPGCAQPKGLVRRYPGFHAPGGQVLNGTYTSAQCRDWCLKETKCWGVDFMGASGQCIWHNAKFTRVKVKNKPWTVCQYAKVGSTYSSSKFILPSDPITMFRVTGFDNINLIYVSRGLVA
jgi:hypothetical protein